MKFGKTILTAGFAMFSMFFGSGNLVFPLAVGINTAEQAGPGMIGLALGGVLVPFLGLIGVILYAGNRYNFFAVIGKWPAFFLTFAMLAMMGPIGVIPRCIIVAYGGIHLVWEQLPFIPFSIGFCLLTMYLVWNHDRVVPILGRILTPLLLVGLTTVILTGIFSTPDFDPLILGISSSEGFKRGFEEAFQTMDLLAAFFFSATTVAYLRAHMRSDDRPSKLIKLSLQACLIGAGLLATVYLGFVFLGSKYAPMLEGVDAEQTLATIAGLTLGEFAVPVVSITIALACLTTATILVMLFADFFRDEVTKGKCSNHLSIIITLVVSCIVSEIGFTALKIWIYNVLLVAYPALIVLTIFNIIHKVFKTRSNMIGRVAFWVTIALVVLKNYA